MSNIESGEWYEIVAFFREDEMEVLKNGDHMTYVHGKIGDVVIAQIDVAGQDGLQMRQSIEVAHKMLETAGIKTALIMPGGIRMMKLRQVDAARAAELSGKFAAEEDSTVH